LGDLLIDLPGVEAIGGVKVYLQFPSPDFLQEGKEVAMFVQEESVIKKGKVSDPSLAIISLDLIGHVKGIPPPIRAGNQMGSAKGAAKGTPSGGENGHGSQTRVKIIAGKGTGIKIRRHIWKGGATGQERSQRGENLRLTLSTNQGIGLDPLASVFWAQTGIHSPQDNRRIGEPLPQVLNDLCHSRIPVGHKGSDQNDIRGRHLGQFPLKKFQRPSVSGELTRDLLNNGGFRQWLPGKLAGAISAAFGSLSTLPGQQLRVVAVQTINQVNFKTSFSNERSYVKEAQRLHPEVKGCKIVNPGVHQEGSHGNSTRQLPRVGDYRWLLGLCYGNRLQ